MKLRRRNSRRGLAVARFIRPGRAVLFLMSGLIAAAPLGGSLAAADPFAAHIAEAARRFAIPERWIRAVLAAESAGDVRAVSPKGAIGLMQLMPATWDDLRLRHGLGNDPFDPHANILAGAAYLREMYDRFGSPGFLAAYNAGPARYEQALATGKPLPAETCDYVAALIAAIGNTLPAKSSPMFSPMSAPIADWRGAPLFVSPRDGDAPAQPVTSPHASGTMADIPGTSSRDGMFTTRRPRSGGSR